MPTLSTSASFLETSEDYGYPRLPEVNSALIGKKIESVEKTSDYSITFRFEGGAYMVLSSGGLEGDDLDLTVETVE